MDPSKGVANISGVEGRAIVTIWSARWIKPHVPADPLGTSGAPDLRAVFTWARRISQAYAANLDNASCQRCGLVFGDSGGPGRDAWSGKNNSASGPRPI